MRFKSDLEIKFCETFSDLRVSQNHYQSGPERLVQGQKGYII